MRTEEEIMNKCAQYQQYLEEVSGDWEQARRQSAAMPELELLILALVDKLEVLFWVLEIPLADPEGLSSPGRLLN